MEIDPAGWDVLFGRALLRPLLGNFLEVLNSSLVLGRNNHNMFKETLPLKKSCVD